MNFERNKETLETLRIGERSKAINIGTIHIIISHWWTERNLDGIDVKRNGQKILLLESQSQDYLMEEIMKGKIGHKILYGAASYQETINNPIKITGPVFYTNKGVTWPDSRAAAFTDGSPFWIKDLSNKWIIVNGKFYYISEELLKTLEKEGEEEWVF